MNVLNQKLAEQKIPSNNKPQTSNVVIKDVQQKKINKKKLAISVAAGVGIAALVVGGLAYKHKIDSKAVKQLAENIEFKNCDTLDDAIKFGKEHLGIKRYKGFKETDLDVLNWINQGLVDINNLTKGKATMPKEVIYETLNDASGTMNAYGTLTISKAQITETKEAIKDFLYKVSKEETAEEFMQKLNSKNNFAAWQNFIISIINKNQNVAKDTLQKSHTSTFATIYHEMGHLQHAVNTKANLVDLAKGQYSDLFKNSIETAKKVSDYAATDPTEFVAETFAKLCTQKQCGGKALDADVMELYIKLGGYILP